MLDDRSGHQAKLLSMHVDGGVTLLETLFDNRHSLQAGLRLQ